MRFRIRYSLRTFLLAFVAISVTAGLWTRRSLEQRQRVRALEGIGLRVKYDLDESTNRGAWNGALRWLALQLGRDCVSVPVAVEPTSNYVVVYPEDCAVLCQLPWLRTVDMYSSGADDECLSFICRLSRLEVLRLKNTVVTDRGLFHLDQCRSLREIDLTDSLVSQASANEFGRRHPQCRVSYLRQLSTRLAGYMRIEGQRTDRVPTPEEAKELAFWLALVEAADNFEKERVIARHLGESLPAPDAPNYPTWEERVKNHPRDWQLSDSITELGKLRLAAAIPALERVARDVTHSEDVRYGAVVALAQIADRRVIPILIELLDDRNEYVAYTARGCLQVLTEQRIGGGGDIPEPATPARRKLIDDWRTYWKQNGDVLRPRRHHAG